ncbi:MAG: M50 family metallopeptidase [Bacillus subtilis]|nr:M50 family metallopeptidase [Bacillus subtilis]
MTTVGGPMMNIILAFVVLLFIYLAFGVANYGSTQIGTVPEGSPASEYLQAGDKIVSINGVIVNKWYDPDSLDPTVVSILSTPSATGYVISYSRGTNEILYSTLRFSQSTRFTGSDSPPIRTNPVFSSARYCSSRCGIFSIRATKLSRSMASSSPIGRN